MPLKLLLIAFGLYVGYAATIRRGYARWPARVAVAVLITAGLIYVGFLGIRVVANLGALGIEVLGADSAGSAAWLRRALAFVVVIPVEALLVGLLVGFLTGDQQNGAERSVGRALEVAAHTTVADSGLAARLFASARSNGVTLLSALLLVVTLFPSGNIGGLFDRLSSAKGFGFEIALKEGEVADVAQALRASGFSRDSSNTLVSPADATGFTKRRLQVFKDLTTTVNDPLGFSSSTPAYWLRPDHYIFAKPNDIGDPGLRIWRIARDRAIVARILLAESRLSVADQAYVRDLGLDQERLLTVLRPQVACLQDVIGRSNDNRLIVMQNFQVVQHLFELARHWTNLEYGLLKPDPEPIPVNYPAALPQQHLENVLVGLSGSVGGFSHWSGLLSRGWNDEALKQRGRVEPLPGCPSFEPDRILQVARALDQTKAPNEKAGPLYLSRVVRSG